MANKPAHRTHFYKILLKFSHLPLDTDTIHLYSILMPVTEMAKISGKSGCKKDNDKTKRKQNMLENTPQASKNDALVELQKTLGDSLFFAKTEQGKTHCNDCNDRNDRNAPVTVQRSGAAHDHEYKHEDKKEQQEQKELQALATLFPCGLRTDELIELVYQGSGCGALAFCLARSVSRDGRAIAVIDPEYQFYPHTALALGVDLSQLIIFRPQKRVDEMWVLDQAIRCRGFAAVLWREPRREPSDGTRRRGKKRGGTIHVRHLRRIQLACQKHNTLGLLLRPRSMSQQWSAAKTRLLVKPVLPVSPAVSGTQPHTTNHASHSRQNHTRQSDQHVVHNPGNYSSFFLHRLRIQRLRGAHLTTGNNVEWEIDHENGTFRQATSLSVAS